MDLEATKQAHSEPRNPILWKKLITSLFFNQIEQFFFNWKVFIVPFTELTRLSLPPSLDDWGVKISPPKIGFWSILTQATLNGHHGQGSDGKKIVQNIKDGQWPSVSGDMCPRPVSQAVWLHWHAKNPQKLQFLTIFATFNCGCRPNGWSDHLRPHTRQSVLE